MANSGKKKLIDNYDPDHPGWLMINKASKVSEAVASYDELQEISDKLLEILIPLQQAEVNLMRRRFNAAIEDTLRVQNKTISELIILARERRIKEFQKNWYHDRIILTSKSINKLNQQITKACGKVDKALVNILPPAYLTQDSRNLYHPPQASTLSVKQQYFLRITTKKLEQYLQHLQKNNPLGADSVLKSKLFEVQFLLIKLRANDLTGFINRWHSASILLARHRPKTFLGQSLAFTSIFSYPGKTLVTAINKLGKELIANSPASTLRK